MFKGRILIVLALLAGVQISTSAQNGFTWDVGAELQAYPTGIIPGISAELGLRERNGLNFRIGMNLFDHRDLGVHDEETGRGPGFSLGYRRYFKDGLQGFYVGVRNDLWFNKVDWTDEIDATTTVTGETEITVVQPTAEAGYQFGLGDSGVMLTPHAAFGWEWNAVTDGEPTGEGAIVLVGVRIHFRVK